MRAVTRPTLPTSTDRNGALQRAADPACADHWIGKLRSGASRVHVAGQFDASLESRRDRIDRMYQDVLGRVADAGGRDHWSRILASEDGVTLAASLAASIEYHRAAQR